MDDIILTIELSWILKCIVVAILISVMLILILRDYWKEWRANARKRKWDKKVRKVAK